MRLSCLLAVAMVMYGPSAGLAVPMQDTANPGGGNAQSTAPAPPETTQSEGAKKETAADATKVPDEAKKPDETLKAGEATKANKAARSTRVAGRRGKYTTRKAEAKPAGDEPRKRVVRHGGALEPTAQIAPDMPQEEAIRQRQKAEEMLVATEDRLRLLGARTLDPQQQETVTQIRNYVEKARSTLKDGDTQRGHTLALKAYLLADDLVKK